MPRARTGSVEPFRRADGTIYSRARIRLGDGTCARVDVSEKYTRPAGGRTGEERAEAYAEAIQEKEDRTGELLAAKRKREADRLVGADAKSLDTAHAATAELASSAYATTRLTSSSRRSKRLMVLSSSHSAVASVDCTRRARDRRRVLGASRARSFGRSRQAEPSARGSRGSVGKQGRRGL